MNVSLSNAACREPAGESVHLESEPPALGDAVRFAQGGHGPLQSLQVTGHPGADVVSQKRKTKGRQKKVKVCHLADARQGGAVA